MGGACWRGIRKGGCTSLRCVCCRHASDLLHDYGYNLNLNAGLIAMRQVAGRCAGTCIDILKSHSQAILSINGARWAVLSLFSTLTSIASVCSDGVLTSSRDGLVRAWLPN